MAEMEVVSVLKSSFIEDHDEWQKFAQKSWDKMMTARLKVLCWNCLLRVRFMNIAGWIWLPGHTFHTLVLKDGFVDGKCSSEEKALQNGFNEGYQAGFQTSYKVAVLKGIFGAVEISLKDSNLKESNPEHLERLEKLKKSISDLEINCIEIKKNMVIMKDSHSLDAVSFLDDDEDDRKIGSSRCSVSKDLSNHITASLKVEKQFHILKENAVQFLEDCGYTLLTNLILTI